MTRKHCCYGVCKSDSRYYGRNDMNGVFFINFPKPITQREKCIKWIRLCGRPSEHFNVDRVNRNTFLCSKHFVGGKGPTSEHPDPIPATATPEQARRYCRPKRKPPTDRATTAISHKKIRQDATEALLSLSFSQISDITPGPSDCESSTSLETTFNPKFITTETQTENDLDVPQNSVETKEASCQTLYGKYRLEYKLDTMIQRKQTQVSQDIKPVLLCLSDIKQDNKKMKYFTGLLYFQFLALYNVLDPCVHNLKYWGQKEKKGKMKSLKKKTSPADELFVTLVHLRRGFGFTTMSFLFKLSETTLRTIFTTWLQLLYFHFKDICQQMFPDRSVLKKFLPKSFRGFNNVCCSIDCTEFFCEMPRNFKRQGNLFSNYKHHHTFKCLIAVAPNGTGVFISDLYEGAISDRDIFEQCGILNFLNPGDLILVDRGFIVEDLLMPRQVSMNIPPFLRGRERLTPQEELLTRKIAKARIHVERYNERLKKFRMISGTMPLSMAPLASQAVYVAACLVNFQHQLAE